jgi:serine/threonine-protein kinase RsbT
LVAGAAERVSALVVQSPVPPRSSPGDRHAGGTIGSSHDAVSGDTAEPTPVCVVVAVDDDIVQARQGGRRLARHCGFSPTDATLLVTAISEIARNILTYAGTGDVVIQVVRTGERRGVEVTAHDDGPGIADVGLAMTDGYTTGSGLGLGLPGAARLVDEVDVQSHRGTGTTVTLRKWRRA